MVLYCLITIRELQTVTGMFLGSLAVTDLGVGLISFPLALASSVKQELVKQRAFCVMQGMATVLFVIASLLTLAVLSLSKYINVGYSVHKRFKKKHAKRAIGGIWTITAMFAIAPTFGLSKYSHRTGAHQCSVYDNSLLGYIYATALTIVGFMLPFMTMLYCYCRLYMTLHSHVRRMRAGNAVHPSSTQQSISSSESQMIHTLIIMVIAFFICWVPSVTSYFLSFEGISVSTTIDTIAVLSVFTNSAVNPILYALRQKDFQRGFRQITRRFFFAWLHRP